MLHLLLAFATIAFALNSLEVQNEQLKKTNEALRNALRAMKTNKEATVVAEVMVGAATCTMEEICEGCDLHGSEQYIGDMTFEECEAKCIANEGGECFGIDYGKGGRTSQCYLNYEDKDTWEDHGSFDAWKKVCVFKEESNQCYSYNDPENATFENCAEGKVCVNYNRSWWNSGKLLFRELYGGCKEANFCPGFRYMADLYGSTTGESVKYCTECSSDKCNTPRN